MNVTEDDSTRLGLVRRTQDLSNNKIWDLHVAVHFLPQPQRSHLLMQDLSNVSVVFYIISSSLSFFLKKIFLLFFLLLFYSSKPDALTQLTSRLSLLGMLQTHCHPIDPRVLKSACWLQAGAEQAELCCMEYISSQGCPPPARPDWLGPASLFPSACQRAGTNLIPEDCSKGLPLAAQPAMWAWFLPPVSLLWQEEIALVLVRLLVRMFPVIHGSTDLSSS